MDRLKKLRKEKNITMKYLGQKIGVSESAVSQYENGKRQPDLVTLVRIANYLNCSTDYLIGRIDSEKERMFYLNTNEHIKYSAEFYRKLISDDGLNVIKKQLSKHIDAYGLDELAEELKLNFTDIKEFLSLDVDLGYKCLSMLDKILSALDTNLYNIFQEAVLDETTCLYRCLDIEDKAEVKGTIKQMLKSEKYKNGLFETQSTFIAAESGKEHTAKTPDAEKIHKIEKFK